MNEILLPVLIVAASACCKLGIASIVIWCLI